MRSPSARPAEQLRRELAEARRASDLSGIARAEHAIVVFGCALDASGEPLPPLRSRLETALAAALRDPGALVIASGRGEAPVMKAWLVARGVAASRIVTEGFARFTLENAELVAPMIARAGATRVTVVSERFHLTRAAALMRGALAALGLAAVELIDAAAEDAVRDPHAGALEADKTERDLAVQRALHALDGDR